MSQKVLVQLTAIKYAFLVKNVENKDQCINFNQKIKSYEEIIAKQNKELDNLFSKDKYSYEKQI